MLPEHQNISVSPSKAPPARSSTTGSGPSLRPWPDSDASPLQESPEAQLLVPVQENPSVSLGIRVKLVALMVAMSFLIVGVLASYFPSRQISELREALRGRATMYGHLASLQLRPAIAFSDQQSAREVLGAIANDPLVLGAAVYSQSGARLADKGQLSELAQSADHGFGAQRTFYLPGRVLVAAPIRSLEGPTGTFVLELSTSSALAARNRLIRAALGVGACALLLGTVLAWMIASSLARRVEGIAMVAAAVAAGDLEQRVQTDGPRDEIGVLAFGFDAMVRRLRDLVRHIHDAARQENARLEQLVQARTRELDGRNADLRLVMDNVDQGFVTIARDGTVVGETSRVIGSWLGALSSGDSLWDSLDAAQPGCGLRFAVAWGEVIDDIMPVEVSLAQMPERLTVGSRHLHFQYKPLGSNSEFEKLLVVISDATAIVERDRTEQEGRDLITVSSRLMSDPSGFLEFVADTRKLLESISRNDGDFVTLKRDLHTLKGNTAIFGVSLVSDLCHAAESALENSADATAEVSSIVRQWERTCEKIQHLLAEGAHSGLEVDEQEYSAVLSALRQGMAASVIERMLMAWRLESLRARLQRMGEQLSSIAMRADKGKIQVVVDAPRLYLASEELREFWSVFAHVLRNAIAHGLETAEERVRLGKDEAARITLCGALRRNRLVIEVADSGPGVDWEALRRLASKLGLPAETDADLVNALFADGVSTRSSADDLAGRGVGLSAVRTVCERQKGTIEVESKPGEGATFRFSWPISAFKSLVSFEPGVAS